MCFRFHHTKHDKFWTLINEAKTQHITCLSQEEWFEVFYCVAENRSIDKLRYDLQVVLSEFTDLKLATDSIIIMGKVSAENFEYLSGPHCSFSDYMIY